MRFMLMRNSVTQGLRKLCRRAIPACGDTAALMPESGPCDIPVGFADGDCNRAIENHVDAASCLHADPTPAFERDQHARLSQADRYQTRPAFAVPRDDQRMCSDVRAATPCLASADGNFVTRLVSGAIDHHPRPPRFSRPNAPNAAQGQSVSSKLVVNRDRVGVRLE